MASKNWTSGTTIDSNWLNDVDRVAYKNQYTLPVSGVVGEDITTKLDTALAAVNIQYADWIDVNKDNLKVGGPVLYIPPGDYVYSGTGFSAAFGYVNIVGGGRDCTRIHITSDVYLCSFVNAMFAKVQGIHFYGGKGIYLVSTTGNNTEGYFDFKDNYFFNFTECAIGCNANDSPNWRVTGNTFFGATVGGERTAIGVALGGKCDESVISENAFQNCRWDIKLDYGSTCTHIEKNGFFKWTTSPSSQVEGTIWLVPSSSPATLDNTGIGINIIDNKFGSENLLSSTYRILIAEETGIGTRNTKLPTVAASTKYIGGLRVKDNTVFSVPNGKALVYSCTQNVWGCLFENTFNGTPIPTIEYISGVASNSNAAQATTNIIKSTHVGASSYVLPYPMSLGVGHVEDVLALYQGHPSVRSYWNSGHDPQALSEYTSQRVTSFSTGFSSYITTTDAVGGVEAIEVTCTAGGGYVSTSLSAPFTPNLAAWIDLDLSTGSTQSLTWVKITLTDATGSGNLTVERRIQLPSGWRRITIPVMSLSNSVAVQNLTIACETSDYSAGVRTKFKIGRVRAYHAAQPVHPGTKYLDSGLVAWAPGTISSNSEQVAVVNVGGAVVGDIITWSFDGSLNGARMLPGYVSSSGQATVVLRNFTGSSVTPSTGNIRVRVLKGV